ncbi:unnamed protein product [Didymodactylos carnosus]|nr:unnamed protein product [Didymodactylos carnosus]CAF3611934.1 unnamed protein product [Didymodactylos carnosus]
MKNKKLKKIKFDFDVNSDTRNKQQNKLIKVNLKQPKSILNVSNKSSSSSIITKKQYKKSKFDFIKKLYFSHWKKKKKKKETSIIKTNNDGKEEQCIKHFPPKIEELEYEFMERLKLMHYQWEQNSDKNFISSHMYQRKQQFLPDSPQTFDEILKQNIDECHSYRDKLTNLRNLLKLTRNKQLLTTQSAIALNNDQRKLMNYIHRTLSSKDIDSVYQPIMFNNNKHRIQLYKKTATVQLNSSQSDTFQSLSTTSTQFHQ